jgi:hypothetical protein
MTFISLPSSSVDAQSPVDEALMGLIKDNLDDHESRLLLTKAFPYQFKVNGYLHPIATLRRKRLDGALISIATTFLQALIWLDEPGTSGTLEIDIKKLTKTNTPITGVTRLFSSVINSIARAGAGTSTQSVTRATSQISTQTITQWKSSINVSSIQVLGGADDLVRYNLASAPDSDWIVGDTVTFASCSTGANNISATIVRINDDGANNVVVSNSSGVDQSGVAGTCTLRAYSYNFSASVNAHFFAGESAIFASHSDAANDGTLTIYAINQTGNNIIVKNATGVVQGGAAGNVNTARWIFAFSGAASSDFVVGENVITSSHTSGSNDGTFPIKAVNSGGNNVILYNTAGVTQGGAAGTVNSKRWVIFFSSDPSSEITAGDTVIVAGATAPANDGEFVVKEVNRTTSDNVVVYNNSGVAQGGSAGTLVTKKLKIKFSSDQSAVYSTDSYVEVFGSVSRGLDDAWLEVLEVNRGGGSNYNVVVESSGASEQVGAAGRIILEGKSIFSTRPSLTLATDVLNSTNRHAQSSSNAVFNAEATVDTGDLLAMDIISIPDGYPKNLVVQIA